MIGTTTISFAGMKAKGVPNMSIIALGITCFSNPPKNNKIKLVFIASNNCAVKA